MVEFDLKEGLSAKSELKQDVIDSSFIEYTDVMTGDSNRVVQLYYQLINSIRTAKKIDIVVSFLMESGVKMLLKELRKAIDNGVKIRLLTGNYLGITQPSALYLIKHELGNLVDLRFYNEKNRSFHPKAYIFHYEKYSDIFIGSSNISRSALTSGIEWNYRFNSLKDADSYKRFQKTFDDLFDNHSIILDDEELKHYAQNWHRPGVSKDLDKYDESSDTNVRMLFEPRGAQIEAICALENSRAEGATRGLVQAATGVGKTYLAAFDSKDYKRVLFVAHREEILKQASRSFYNVRNSEDYGFFDGKNKTCDKSVIFASVSTLGRKEYLNAEYFAPDYFEYIVIDEFHHAVNDQYKRIVDYFKPKFLLGLTATPERMDGRSIYEICDYNVPYEISLRDAINRGALVPFHYYGIYDNIVDYSKIRIIKGKYDEKELNKSYIGNVHRHELIYKNYKKFGSQKALGFCCSREHAEEMAKEFSLRGIPSAAVYSNSNGEYSQDRSVAIQKLQAGEIKVIFSVDMFNEGVDIKEIDMVMFLRPTESPIVFLQQLGRGLRKAKNKQYLNVLDFIGNYQKAGKTFAYLTGKNKTTVSGYNNFSKEELPDDCLVDYDFRLIDLFEEIQKRQTKLTDLIFSEYERIKEEVGHRPSRLELFTLMDDEVYQKTINNSSKNIFKHYLRFLEEHNELTLPEQQFCRTIGREFIELIETTSMSKVYKMPVLKAFYNNGNCLMKVNEDQLLKSWKEYFAIGANWRDLPQITSYQQYKNMLDKDHVNNIYKNPVKFLAQSGKGFFIINEDRTVSLKKELDKVVNNPIFAEQFGDVIEYRTMDYYSRRLAKDNDDIM
ncbi:DEAD/DEAH box helicase family protein [Lachnobacterium bovis]|uniref:DEAD/DEAH box helicase family protein n=1 Tax=Lachnobacterium bovis TaxID=140626 RepID=UPI0003B2FE56|nr:DEAD/DEAH box helicase family protein [Lachnobacterium bovis]